MTTAEKNLVVRRFRRGAPDDGGHRSCGTGAAGDALGNIDRDGGVVVVAVAAGGPETQVIAAGLRYPSVMPTKKTAATAATAATATTKKKASAKKAKAQPANDPEVAAYITQRFAAVADWRGATAARMRSLIFQADPEMFEQRQWIKPTNPHGVPTYSHGGLIATIELYKSAVKLTFAQGSQIPDPTGIFNASLLGLRRAIDISEGDVVDAAAFCALITAAVSMNVDKTKV